MSSIGSKPTATRKIAARTLRSTAPFNRWICEITFPKLVYVCFAYQDKRKYFWIQYDRIYVRACKDFQIWFKIIRKNQQNVEEVENCKPIKPIAHLKNEIKNVLYTPITMYITFSCNIGYYVSFECYVDCSEDFSRVFLYWSLAENRKHCTN